MATSTGRLSLPPARIPIKASSWSLSTWLHLILFVLISGVSLYFYLRRATLIPQGDWDAWAIWNLRAKFLYAGSPDTFRYNPLAYSHLDYPILWPLIVAFGWLITGGFTPAVPILLQGLVLLAILFLLRRWLWAVALVGLVVARYAAMQYADLPVSLALLAACAAYSSKRDVLAGVALGIACLTKNEGALMLAGFFAAWVLLTRRIPIKALLAAAPFVIALWWFKRYVNVTNDVMSGNTGFAVILEKITDPDRYAFILQYIAGHTLPFGTGALPALAAILLVRWQRIRLTVPLLAVALIFAGFIGVYVIDSVGLEWHMPTSYDRLLLQLFAPLVYALAMSSSPKQPEAAPEQTPAAVPSA